MVAGHGGLKGINMGMHAYGKYAQAWGQAMAWAYVVGSTLDINSYALVLQARTAHVQANHVHGSMPCLNPLNLDVYLMDVFLMSYVWTIFEDGKSFMFSHITFKKHSVTFKG